MIEFNCNPSSSRPNYNYMSKFDYRSTLKPYFSVDIDKCPIPYENVLTIKSHDSTYLPNLETIRDITYVNRVSHWKRDFFQQLSIWKCG